MLRKALFSTAVLLILLAWPLQAASQEGLTVLITGVNVDQFPQVRITFRARDADNRVIADLTSERVFIFENNAQVESVNLELRDDTPLTVIYVIDLGRYSNYDAFGLDSIRRTLTHLVDSGIFRDGQDTVEILGRVNNSGTDETVILLRATQSAIEFTEFVNSLDFARSFGGTQALIGVESALQRMPELAQPDQAATAIVLLTPFIDTLRSSDALQYAEGVGDTAHAQQIPVYTLHTHLRGELPEPLEALASRSGGQYLRLLSGADQTAELGAFYQSMASQRIYYAASYRSTLPEPGKREVVVSVDSPAGLISALTSYEVPLPPPSVAITAPADGATVTLTIESGPEGETTITPASLTVVADLGPWPDGAARAITQAELAVNSQPVTTITPGPTDTRFEFSWPVPPVEAGASQPVSFQVRVRDEFGLVGESAPITVNLVAAEVQPEAGFFRACFANPLRLSCIAVFAAPFVIVLGLLAVGAVLVIQRQQRARKAGLGVGEAAPVYPTLIAADESGAPAIGRPQALATLRVIQGPADLAGSVIPVQKGLIKIGRNPDLTDITFYKDEPSSVSSQHCTLQSFRGSFFLTDNNSRNGTTVNGEPLVPERPHTLHDGDRIVLGNLQLKGVELEFAIGEMSDPRTMIASELDSSYAGSAPSRERDLTFEEDFADKTYVEPDEDDEPGQPPARGKRAKDDWMDQLR